MATSMTALVPESLSVTDTAGGLASIPGTAHRALIYVEGAPIRWRADGTSATSSDNYVAAGSYIDWTDPDGWYESLLKNASFIRATGTSATLRVTYFA